MTRKGRSYDRDRGARECDLLAGSAREFGNTEFVSRLTAVEESAKQAHKRIDRIEEVQERERHE